MPPWGGREGSLDKQMEPQRRRGLGRGRKDNRVEAATGARLTHTASDPDVCGCVECPGTALTTALPCSLLRSQGKAGSPPTHHPPSPEATGTEGSAACSLMTEEVIPTVSSIYKMESGGCHSGFWVPVPESEVA